MLHRRTTLQTGRLVYFEYCCWFRRIRRFGCGQLHLGNYFQLLDGIDLFGHSSEEPTHGEVTACSSGFPLQFLDKDVALLQPGWES